MGSCRCKMCGGHIHYEADASVATCEFCGTEQTIVKTDDVKKVNLFNRANALRLQNEFDKAQLTYDNILIDEPNNAEAHWGICLCRYGIEYVTVDNKKVPTCHRTEVKSIFDDLDYKETINNADVVAKRVYETEAKVIDKIQKDILSISQKEEQYDIFISYKEHLENNDRTKDSYKAESIYNALKEKGYRVFFSRVALKDKEVSLYEPIIFAALMSSKVMISLGSKKEYFYAIWEKNEWARFMALMKDDRKKYLIPCFFDMDKSDLPTEFEFLDAQDVSSNNLDDLVKRIDKLFTTKEKVVISKEQVEVREQVVNKLSVDNNIGRIGLFLADGKFSKVNEFVENVLNIDFKCALAYYYRMLASYGCKNDNELIEKRIVLDNDIDYEKALKFADSDLTRKLKDIKEKVNEAILKKEKEDLIKTIDSLVKNKKYVDAINKLDDLKKYDETYDEIIRIKEEIYSIANEKRANKAYDEAISIFSLLDDYKDSVGQIGEIKYQLRIDEENKKCDKLCEEINTLINRINYTKVYDEDYLRRINNKINEIRELELCPYSMEKVELYKGKYKALVSEKEKSKKVNKIVALVMAGGAILAIIFILLYMFVFSKK